MLGENEAVREKIRFLEGIVQDITKERDAFKAMMKQLTTSQVSSPPIPFFLSLCTSTCTHAYLHR